MSIFDWFKKPSATTNTIAPVAAAPQTNLPWYDTAKSYIGLKEGPLDMDNDEIIRWAKVMAIKDYKKDSIPWCGLFTAWCIFKAKLAFVKNPLWALNWANYATDIRATGPAPGAILAFKREGGGHVGFYVSEDADTYHVLGGNQSDMVCVTRVLKSQLRGMRWPTEYMHLYKPHKVVRKLDGKITSSKDLA